LVVFFKVNITVNEVIDYDTAEIVATELGAKVEKEVVVTIEDQIRARRCASVSFLDLARIPCGFFFLYCFDF